MDIKEEPMGEAEETTLNSTSAPYEFIEIHNHEIKIENDVEIIPSTSQSVTESVGNVRHSGLKIYSRKKRSPNWNFFEIIDGTKALCKICKLKFTYSSSISNLKKHLKSKHPLVLYKERDVPSFISDLQVLPSHSNSSSAIPDSTGVVVEDAVIEAGCSTSNTLPKPACLKGQTVLGEFTTQHITPAQKDVMDSSLMAMIIKDYQPFSIVEDSGFREYTAALNPNYQLPSRELLSDTLLKSAHAKCMEETKLKIINAPSVCLTTDCWTSSANQAYLAVTAHFIQGDFQLVSCLLDCSAIVGSHTANNLAEQLKRVTNEWGLQDKILVVVTDNASNIVSAVKGLKWKHWECYAHTLNLIVQGVLVLPMVADVLKKVKGIVDFFKDSSLATEKLLRHQTLQKLEGRSLVQEVPTRWNSTYAMLQRFVELQDSVKSTLATMPTDVEKLSDTDWEICREMVQILKPFVEATTAMCGEKYFSASHLLAITYGLIGLMEVMKTRVDKYCLPIVDELLKGLNLRFQYIEHSGTIGMTTFLDPRYKNYSFLDRSIAGNVKQSVIKLVSASIRKITPTPSVRTISAPSSDDFSIWSSFDKTISQCQPEETPELKAILEVQRYLNQPMLPRKDDPLKWWKDHALLLPNISEIARKNLNVPATSVPCERIFSKAGYILDDRRTRLGPGNVSKLVFLNANWK